MDLLPLMEGLFPITTFRQPFPQFLFSNHKKKMLLFKASRDQHIENIN